MIARRDRLVVGAAMVASCIGVLLGLEQSGAQSLHPPPIVSVCAPCHGVDGHSANVETPNLGGQPGIYLREQLIAFRLGSRRHPRMKRLARDLTDREINELVVYFSLLPPP